MQKLIRRGRSVVLLLIAVIACELLPLEIANGGNPPKVENVRVTKELGRIIILYDLSGDKDELYSVSLTLRREQTDQFEFVPKNLMGEVGDDITTGFNRKIVWEVDKEFPHGLKGDDFYFYVEASTQHGISPLVWISGGVAVAGAAVFIVFSKKSDNGGTKSVQGFPPEPGRPN
jgi:hypothetical protein